MTSRIEPASENTGKKQKKLFRRGQSGNPSGRPKGSLNKTTIMMRAMLESEAEEITRTLIALAKSGDAAAIKLVLERLLPPRKDTPIALSLPNIKKAEDVVAAFDFIQQELSQGNITPLEAEALCSVMEHSRKAIETTQLAHKITALEHIILSRSKHA